MKPLELFSIALNVMLPDDRERLFRYIWKNYRERLYYYILSFMKCPREDGEDLLQEVMIKVHENLHQYKPGNSFSSWIYVIARNHCLDFHRKNKSIRCDEEYQEGHGGYPDVFEILCGSELNRVINESLQRLDDVEREMVYLRYFEGLRFTSIGTILDMNVNSVKTRMRAVEARLRQELKGWL